jgi:NAD(P)-dependent dehydrogenase (short-subunit alcohol dehydrogenase family)
LNDGASIILNASIATVKGFSGTSVYSATKAAVRSFARTWTNELRERRIRVNAISPGHIDTPIFQSWQQGDELTKMKEDLAKNVPLGRLGDPDEIAKAVSFLASDEASYISGIELFVDGGIAQIWRYTKKGPTSWTGCFVSLQEYDSSKEISITISSERRW